MFFLSPHSAILPFEYPYTGTGHSRLYLMVAQSLVITDTSIIPATSVVIKNGNDLDKVMASFKPLRPETFESEEKKSGATAEPDCFSVYVDTVNHPADSLSKLLRRTKALRKPELPYETRPRLFWHAICHGRCKCARRGSVHAYAVSGQVSRYWQHGANQRAFGCGVGRLTRLSFKLQVQTAKIRIYPQRQQRQSLPPLSSPRTTIPRSTRSCLSAYHPLCTYCTQRNTPSSLNLEPLQENVHSASTLLVVLTPPPRC